MLKCLIIPVTPFQQNCSLVWCEKTKRAAVTRALEEFVARRRQKRLMELMGKLEWDASYDYKAERSRG